MKSLILVEAGLPVENDRQIVPIVAIKRKWKHLNILYEI